MSHRPPVRDLLVLAALCAVVFFLGLSTHGLTNWQEAQRALVAREMHDRGEWLVPMVHDRPYLAKPPMVYWAPMALARLTGTRPGEWHLRATVALASSLGVLGVYLLGRRMLREPDGGEGGGLGGRAWAQHAAWWAALFLGTGILSVRSGRIGELDAILVPFVVGAVWAIDAAWRSHRQRGRTAWAAVLAACMCAAGAALTKGPPGLLVIGLAAYGGIALRCAVEHPPRGRRAWGVVAACALAAAAAVAATQADQVRSFGEGVGLTLMMACAAVPAALVGALARPAPLRACIAAFARTHPVAVLGAGTLALWAWGRAVTARIGPDAVRAAMELEASENLQLFVHEAPVAYLEAAVYGVGLGSIAAIAAFAWLARDRVRPTPGLCTLLAWVALGVCGFAVLSKGVPRYLTPVWPGVALLGGAWMASAVRDFARGRALARGAGVAVAVMAVGHGAWYGYLREAVESERSPRAFIAALREPGLLVDPSRLASVDFWHPAVEYYAGVRVEPYFDAGPETRHPFGAPLPLSVLVDRVRAEGAWTVLVRSAPHADAEPGDPLDRIRAAGLEVTPLTVGARFEIDYGRTEVIAVRVRAAKR
ncbi:MAG TPA: hypothetical protein PLU35_03495 [Phycisphaerales bacterium]|nr:hypothetical protein [Phycisphaerales bacterium]